MKKQGVTIAGICCMLLMISLAAPVKSEAGISISIGVPLPRLVISAPPALIMIPGTHVYYPPEVGPDIFFYGGYWYRPYQGAWFIASEYNGPWGYLAVERVPRVLHRIPPRYRSFSHGYGRVPYPTVRKNWRAGERDWRGDRFEQRGNARDNWDRGNGSRNGNGRDRDTRGRQRTS